LGFGGSYAPPGFGNLKPSFLVIWRYRGYCPQLRITGEADATPPNGISNTDSIMLGLNSRKISHQS
jgi:hypothetical protein